MTDPLTLGVKSIGRFLRNRIKKSIPELDPFEAYQLWADTYDQTEQNALIFAEESVIIPLLEKIPIQGKSVLDAACGTGRYLRKLNEFNPGFLAGIDFSPQMIRRARERLDGFSKISLNVADLKFLPFRGSTFDLVICTLALDHVSAVDRAIWELARVLRPNGSMIISTFHPEGRSLGWQRTFHVEEEGKGHHWCAVKYYAHRETRYLEAFESADLEVLATHEPWIDDTLKPF